MAETEVEPVKIDLEGDEETEVEVAEVGLEEGAEEDFSEQDDDPFKKAETSTQKRIGRLTKKMREAERREKEAIRYAQGVQQESQTLKERLQTLDTNYVSEYSNRVSSQMTQAEEALARAIEIGDSAATVEAQRTLTNLAIQADRAEQAKMQSERAKEQEAAAQQYQAQQYQAQQPKRPDRKAEQWALRNSWFGDDEAMTYAAFGIHKKMVEEEGFDPTSDDYYTELDSRIAEKFNIGETASNKRPGQTVVGATRNTTSGRNGKRVRLTPSQVAIAKKLGVPLEEYAKYVKD